MAPPQRSVQHTDVPLLNSRRGFFWVGVDRKEMPFGTIANGAMYVEWEEPEEVRHPDPIVLVHGGGGQGTDWLGTPDGRPGWATFLVQEGFTVYVVDRPGHGRSPLYPEALGEVGPPLTYELFRWLFGTAEQGPFPNPAAKLHTAWPGSAELDDPSVDQLLASFGPALRDGVAAQRLEQSRMVELIDRIGPAILIAHSAGGPAAWLAADARPLGVKGLVAIEPIGPPFLENEMLGLSLRWGLTAAPLSFDPAVDDPAELQDGTPRRLPNLADLPIALVSGEASPMAPLEAPLLAFLREAGCDPQSLPLAESGVRGNGHGMMMETNNREALGVILDWLDGAGLC
jgi:pimeloyl-ACP methyl ester carboxylesterase